MTDFTNATKTILTRQIPTQLMKIQDKYGVLIFRKTGLDNERHVSFARQLGKELEINPFFYGIENDRIGDPLLWDVSKYVTSMIRNLGCLHIILTAAQHQS